MQEMQDTNLVYLNVSQPPQTFTLPTADSARRSYVHLLAAAVGMLTLTLTAIIANMIVITIFFKHRRLRRCKNVYLVGLSAADLGVGLCMPVGLADEMLIRWAPRGLPCRVYLVVRDSLLFISLLTVLQGVLFVCWTPLTVVSIINAATQSRVLPRWAEAASLWLLLANSALNPFLYGLFNDEFGKVVMRWFKIKGSKRDRLKTALRRFSMHIAVELEKNGYGQTTFQTVVE